MSDAVPNSANEAPDSLQGLPSVVLQQVLSLLAPSDLLHVVCCSKLLHAIGTADGLWRQHCEDRCWGPFELNMSWFKGYCWECSRLCVECRGPTRYSFKLLDCRLCEKCEFEHPKYSLVTTREATERYSLTSPQLALLDSVPFRTTRLYLRSAVLHVARTAAGAPDTSADLASSRGGGYPAGAEEDELAELDVGGMFLYSEEEAEEAEEEAGQVLGQQGPAVRDSEQQAAAAGDGDDAEEAWEAASGRKRGPQGMAAKRAAEKAARKANKKQVKEQQRQKRQMKAVPLSCSPLPGSTPPATTVLWTHPRLTSPPASSNGSSPQISTFVAPCTPPGSSSFLAASGPGDPSSFWLASGPPSDGFHPGATPPDSGFLTGGTPPSSSFLEASSSFLAAPSSFLAAPGLSGAKKSKGPRQKTARSSKVWTEDGTHVVSRRKEVSGWLAERQQLMAEWGEYSMSGLVLAT